MENRAFSPKEVSKMFLADTLDTRLSFPGLEQELCHFTESDQDITYGMMNSMNGYLKIVKKQKTGE